MLRILLTAFLAALFGTGTWAKPSPATVAGEDEDVLITLQRMACLGSCPDYTVTIDGKGNVRFQTRGAAADGFTGVDRDFTRNNGVLVPGSFSDRIDPAVVRDLVAQFRAADFFRLNPEYRATITDQPTHILTFRDGALAGGRTMRVIDYAGGRAGMPASVTALEKAVDRAAGTARWIEGADGIISWLEQQDFDFTSPEARAIALRGASGRAPDATIIALLERGAALDGEVRGRRPLETLMLGQQLVIAAVAKGRPELFAWLARRGWVERTDRQALEATFADFTAGCSPALVEAFAQAGLAIDVPGKKGETALSGLANNYRCNKDYTALSMARALLDRGADPNHRNDAGETAIFDVEYLPLLDLFYARGARADVTDKEGNSAVFSTWTDEIVLRHLQAGAPRKGRFYDGSTLEERMGERPLPLVRQWLEDHPEAAR